MKKKDIRLWIGILAAAAVLWLGFRLFAPPQDMVVVTVDGKFYGEYPLSAERVVQVNGTNTFEISGGQVRMLKADCPDQICVKHRPLGNGSAGSIICLPNRVAVELKAAAGNKKAAADATAG